MRLTRSRDRPPLEQWSFVVLISLLSAGLWFGWFGWDTEYQYDADTGARTGPYEIWQGVGAFLCAIVVVALAYRLLHFAVAVVVIPASFTLACCRDRRPAWHRGGNPCQGQKAPNFVKHEPAEQSD